MNAPSTGAEHPDRALPRDGAQPSGGTNSDTDTSAGVETRTPEVRAEHAELLRQIHQLATEGTRRRQNITAEAAGDIAVMAQLVSRAAALDLHRAAIEMHARSSGVLDHWINWARLLGQTGRDWPDNRPPELPALRGRHAGLHRVEQDARCLTDMAAVAATHEYRHGGADSTARGPFGRAMDARWLRAAYRARAIGMTGHERSDLWAMNSHDWSTHVAQVMQMTREDVAMLWGHYTDPAATGDLLVSLHQLRQHSGHVGAPVYTHADTELLPRAPAYYLTKAREALQGLIAPHPQANPAIGGAIADVLPATGAGREWDTSAPDARAGQIPETAHNPGAGQDL
ncbi:hypothetical protein ABIA39_007532 [Nocardia sp. GAS34]|uniref:hypothetical protein n=1 Tax=unclassified Nocardia TaxID=2637762 RepID=UPI003D24E177